MKHIHLQPDPENMNKPLTLGEYFKGQQDILEIIRDLTSMIDVRFRNIETDLGVVKHRLGAVDNRLGIVENKMGSFVTKDYLDDKLADLRGDILGVVSGQNDKMMRGFHLLHEKKIFSSQEIASLSSMKPFPKKP